MNRNQFISFMGNPDKLSGGDGVLLGELLKNFPYFQTAHLLYAKSLHNQNSIHYNNQLKITATYATDRKVLHYLITNKPEPPVEIVQVPETRLEIAHETEQIAGIQVVLDDVKSFEKTTEIPEKVIVEAKLELIEKVTENKQVPAAQEEIVIEQAKTLENVLETTEEKADLKETIIETPVLIEKLVDTKEEAIEPKPVLFENDASDNIEAIENKDEIILDEIEKEYFAQAAISKNELEILNAELAENNEQVEGVSEQATVESTFVLNIPVASEIEAIIDNQVAEETETNFDSSQPHSFTEWLESTSKTAKIIHTELKPEEKPEERTSKKSATDIIDNFLREQPKMSKPKAEFYNPVNMAKQSVAEDITFVSETLAKIFMLQGNYIRALQAYENLRLKYPEKRLYFASQIKNLRKLINQQKQ